MADILVMVQTWACPNCEYKQSHNPANEQEMNQIFCEARYAGRPVGACPACWSGENAQKTKGEYYLESISGVDLSALGQKRVADDATLESTEVPAFDENGQPIMVQTGTRWELAIDQATGKVGSIEVPVCEQQTRSLTDQELADLKLQAAKDLDPLESVAVKEV